MLRLKLTILLCLEEFIRYKKSLRQSDEFEEGGYKLSGLDRLNGVAAMHDFIEFRLTGKKQRKFQ
jgi:hypothetical protein